MIVRIFAFLIPLLVCIPLQAKVYVVVNNDMPVEKITKGTLKNLYLGKTNQVEGVFVAGLIDRHEKTKAEFYEALTGLSLGQVNAYWARLRFSGRKKAPIEISSEGDFLDYLRKNKRVLGYSAQRPTDDKLKVIYTFP